MINKKWCVNVLLCGKCDKSIENVNNIFNKLYINEENKAHFDIVTIISAVGCDEKQFGLYYFIEQITKTVNKVAYLGSTIHYREENEDNDTMERGETYASSVKGAVFKTHRMRIGSCEFPGVGEYELKVFKFDNDEMEIVDTEYEDEADKFYDDDHLITVYPFKVQKNK